jgi:hypothetical protein
MHTDHPLLKQKIIEITPDGLTHRYEFLNEYGALATKANVSTRWKMVLLRKGEVHSNMDYPVALEGLNDPELDSKLSIIARYK